MAAVRASTRVSIAWKGEAAYEDTDTLVLTINGWSLDLRVFNTGQNGGEVDWSTVARVDELPTSTKENPKLRWTHIIDSRPPTDMEDEGVFTSLSNGDVEEHGTMYNPKTGEYEVYVETWRRFESIGDYCVLERLSKEGDDGTAFLARVGSRALGLKKGVEGRFSAWRADLREGNWARVFEQDAEGLPDLPIEIPTTWHEDCDVEVGEQRWIVRTVGKV